MRKLTTTSTCTDTRGFHVGAFLSLAMLSPQALADIYTYTNEDGDYVVSKTRPKDPNISYAVLTDDGEFIRMVEGRNKRLPISHWRPFFLPKEPHPFDGPTRVDTVREPRIEIDEVQAEDSEAEPER